MVETQFHVPKQNLIALLLALAVDNTTMNPAVPVSLVMIHVNNKMDAGSEATPSPDNVAVPVVPAMLDDLIILVWVGNQVKACIDVNGSVMDRIEDDVVVPLTI